ncbi:hypothetical protein BRC92_05800, partial [Halobacteriales archaeon QS_4_69_31]
TPLVGAHVPSTNRSTPLGRNLATVGVGTARPRARGNLGVHAEEDVIAAGTSVPIATGERLFSRWDFKEVLASGAIDVAQPDVSHAGGITETKKIADMAAAYDVALAPHCPLGPVSLAACLQVDACAPNALVQEQVVHRGDGVPVWVENPELFDYSDDGAYVSLPEKPGLGVAVDEDALAEVDADSANWSAPRWHHDDGSVAEW